MKILMELFERAGLPAKALHREPGSLMAFGNLLPDSLPLIGVPSDVSHSSSRACDLLKEVPAVALGIMVHQYSDNITHCDELDDCGSYNKSFALQLGNRWHKESGGRFDGLLKRIKRKSLSYILHIIIEISADVVIAADKEVIELIYNAWKTAWEQPYEMVAAVGCNFEVEAEDLLSNMRRLRSGDVPPPETIYSREARAELFLRKFEPDLPMGDQFRLEDKLMVPEMIALGENVVLDEIGPFITKTAGRILEHSKPIKDFITGIEI